MAQNNQYSARPLFSSREYAGYQFYAQMKMDGYSAEKCFCYAALTIQNWLCERIANAGNDIPKAFRCVPADRFVETEISDLQSAVSNIAGIVSIPDDGIWALWVHEHDPEINGRAYKTHAAVRLLSDTTVELGTYIDIIDSDTTLKEADFAFRPKFIRLLFQTPGLHIMQDTLLQYKNYTTISTKKSIRSLYELVESINIQMPIIVFTHVVAKKQDQDEIIRKFTMTPANSDLPFLHSSLQNPESRAFQLLPNYVDRNLLQEIKNASDTITEQSSNTAAMLPYDVAEFAGHTYGFGEVFVISPEMFSELQRKYARRSIHEGDILLIEPISFGGEIHIYPYRPGLNKNAYAGVTNSLQNQLMRYSKHKSYSFGNILFDEAARNRLKEIEYEDLRKQIASTQTEIEKKLLEQLEEEQKHSVILLNQIESLRSQLIEEYQKGLANERSRSSKLEEKLTETKRENANLRDQVNNMKVGYTELKGFRDAYDSIRLINHMPNTNEDVINFFKNVYRDRIAFTNRGERTAVRCNIRAEKLWECLFAVATELCQIHRDRHQDVETVFMEHTGWEVSMCEGSQTRNNPKLMALRKDSYLGREISIEPHVKFVQSDKKTGAAYQRLYYCYDDETRLIIIGYVGDHLENYSTRNLS